MSQRIEWVEHFYMLGDEIGGDIWKRGTIVQYLNGWFSTKIVVRVEECLFEGEWSNVSRPYLTTMRLDDVANLL